MRPKSVILSKSEKAAALKELKTKLKDAQITIKAQEGLKKSAQKTYDAAIKSAAKALAAANKVADGLTAQINALNAPAE